MALIKVVFILRELYLSLGTVTKYNSINSGSLEQKAYLSEGQKESTFKHTHVFKSKYFKLIKNKQLRHQLINRALATKNHIVIISHFLRN